jgi:hypothetical protein
MHIEDSSVEKHVDEPEEYKPPIFETMTSETSSKRSSPEKRKDSFSSPMKLKAPQNDSKLTEGDSRPDRILPWPHIGKSSALEEAKEFEAKYLHYNSPQQDSEATKDHPKEKKSDSKGDLYFLSAIRRKSQQASPPKKAKSLAVTELMNTMASITKIQRHVRRWLSKKRAITQTSTSIDYTGNLISLLMSLLDFNSFGGKRTNGTSQESNTNKSNPIFIQDPSFLMNTSENIQNYNVDTKHFTQESSIHERESHRNLFTSADSRRQEFGPAFGALNQINQSSIDFEGMMEKIEKIDNAKSQLKERYGQLEVHAKKIEKLKDHLDATQKLMEEQNSHQGGLNHEVHQLIVEYGK